MSKGNKNKNKKNNQNTSDNSSSSNKANVKSSNKANTNSNKANINSSSSSNNANHNSNNDSKTANHGNNKRINLTFQQRRQLSDLVLRLLELGYKSTGNPKDEWEQYVEMQTILQRVLQLEAPLQRFDRNATTESRLKHIDAFNKWATDNGVRTDCLKIAIFPGYQMGLQATRDIAKGEEVLTIPRKLIFSEENLASERCASQFGPMTNLNLAYALIMETVKTDSFWKPYIDIMPERYNTVLYFTIEQMEELRGSNALSGALRQCKMIARQYAYLYKCTHLTPEMGKITTMGNQFKEQFSYDLYRWAVSTVMTRENLLPRSNGESQMLPHRHQQQLLQQPPFIAALIPFWDMANHKPGKITSFYNAETLEMQSASLDDVKANEQFFIYYGDRSNAELMIHNGFIDPDNNRDSVGIKLGLSASDPLVERREQLLKMLEIPRCAEFHVMPPPDYISAKLLAFVRVFNMSAEQLDHWSANAERATDLLHRDCALETYHESKTWQYLHTRLMLLLRTFPTTLEADEQQLAEYRSGSLALSEISAMLLEYRLLEKRILAAALENAKERSKA